MVDTKQEPFHVSKTSAVGRKTVRLSIFELNDTSSFILYIFFMGYLFIILRMSWYKCMISYKEIFVPVPWFIPLYYTIIQTKKCWVEWLSTVILKIPFFLTAIYLLLKRYLYFEQVSISDHIQQINMIQNNTWDLQKYVVYDLFQIINMVIMMNSIIALMQPRKTIINSYWIRKITIKFDEWDIYIVA